MLNKGALPVPFMFTSSAIYAIIIVEKFVL